MRKLTLEEFKLKADIKFKNKYDYRDFNYKGMKIKSIIYCPQHGKFLQSPENHLHKNSKGCPNCAKSHIAKACKNRDYSKIPKKQILTKENFLERCIEKYNNKFVIDLSKYNGLTKTPITITCPVHGLFEIKPKYFLNKNNKTGCEKCGNTLAAENKTVSYESFIYKCQKKFDFKYTYPTTNTHKYENSTSTIDIVCPIHGLFSRNAQKHLQGIGCHKCIIEKSVKDGIIIGRYNENLFEKKPEIKNLSAVLYYTKLEGSNYYKIGITKTNFKNRIKKIVSDAKKHGKDIKPVLVFQKTMCLYDAFKYEQQILQKYKNFRIYRKWSTELFSVDLSIYPEFLQIFG